MVPAEGKKNIHSWKSTLRKRKFSNTPCPFHLSFVCFHTSSYVLDFRLSKRQEFSYALVIPFNPMYATFLEKEVYMDNDDPICFNHSPHSVNCFLRARKVEFIVRHLDLPIVVLIFILCKRIFKCAGLEEHQVHNSF